LQDRIASLAVNEMTIQETVERFITEFEQNRENGMKYFWWEAYDRALVETDPSRRARSVAFAETVLYGRRRQLEEFSADPDAAEELAALQTAMERLRRD
jgi:hypothetical protein